MGVSIEERQLDLTRALQLLLRQLGDQKINIFSFDPTVPPFSSVAEATWDELREMNYVHAMLNPSEYGLTGSGWLRALQRSGATRNRDFDRDAEKLLASITKLAKRARLATLKALAQESDLPESWIYNAIAISSSFTMAEKEQTGRADLKAR